MEPIDDGLRNSFRRTNAEPAESHIIDPDFLQRRDLRRVLQPRRCGDGEDLELSAFILRHDGERRRNVEMDASGDELLHDLWSAPERNPIHVYSGKILQVPR